jgi:hypothetical protein
MDNSYLGNSSTISTNGIAFATGTLLSSYQTVATITSSIIPVGNYIISGKIVIAYAGYRTEV